MSSDVEWLRLDQVVDEIIDRRGVTPIKLGGDFVESGHRVISAKLIKGGRVQLDADVPRFVDSTIYKKWMKSPLCVGDVLMTSEAPLGELAFLDCDTDWVLGQRLFAIRPKKQILDGRFLYYTLHTDQVRADIQGRATGTTVQGIRQAELRLVQVPIPSMPAQLAAATILAALDDRITLLRETNATLEAIAQAIFKSWFVDFDPVRAKQEGRAPEGMDEATAALFPDSFEESALGLVPSGWRVRAISEGAEVVKGKSYSSKDLTDSHHTALVTLKSFERGGGFRLDGFKPYTGSYKSAQVVEPGDLIVAYTDVTQAAELIGKPAIVVGVEDHSTLVASLDVGIVHPDEEQVSRQFLYGLFRTEVFQSHTFSHTSGTTVLHLAKDGVGSFQFACPPADVVNAFSLLAESLAQRNQTNIDQMRTLATLRDTLLPRLISGQLRLPDAEDIIAETVT